MTPDQKGRLAVWYSVAFTAFAGLVAAISVMPKLPVSALSNEITSGKVAMALGLVLLVVAATSLLRYLLFSLFAPAHKPSGASR